MLTWALRRLDGQVVSLSEAKDLHVLPGSHIMHKRSLSALHKDLIRALVLLEGSLPPNHLNPILHHLVHYAEQTASNGVLRWMAMWKFERFNKKIKNMIRNASSPLASLANCVQLDIATRFLELVSNDTNSVTVRDVMDRAHTCRLSGRATLYTYVRKRC